MNIVVAMAGLGSRFQEQGHLYPKPLIRTGNTTMIQNVYYSLEWPDADWHFVVKMQHLKDHPFMKSLLESMGSITAIEETTQGAAETLQKCSEVMTSSNPFISVNCDQVFEWDTTSLQKKITTITLMSVKNSTTAGLPTNNATTGFYHFHNGEIFNNSVNTLLSKPPEYGEYYVAAVYNELITEGHDVRVDRVHANTFWPVGVQHDWQHYTHRHYRK